MRLMSDDELKRSKRAIYANVGSLYAIVAGASLGICLWFPNVLSLKYVLAGINLLIFKVGSHYVTRSIAEIEEYTVMRNEYLKTLHPDWQKKIKSGRE